MMKALIIVDIQNDFFNKNVLAVPNGPLIISRINALQKYFSCIVATKDWHPLKHISFASTHGKKVGERVEVSGQQHSLWPDHCIQDTQGAEFPSSLETKKIQKVIFKGIDPKVDSYSAFFDNLRWRSTGLGEYLTSLSIQEIYVVGVATDYCIKYSVLDARQLGFKTYVIMDACQGIDLISGDSMRAFSEMRASGAYLLNTQDVF